MKDRGEGLASMLHSDPSPRLVDVSVCGSRVAVDNRVSMLPDDREIRRLDDLPVAVALPLGVAVDVDRLPASGSAAEVSKEGAEVLVVTPAVMLVVALPCPAWEDKLVVWVVPSSVLDDRDGPGGNLSEPESAPGCPGRMLVWLEGWVVSVAWGDKLVHDLVWVLVLPV